MTLAIFDLDFTIIEGDSEWMWGEFLYEKGIVDAGLKMVYWISGNISDSFLSHCQT
jgi:phosphoserine phosphatase